jgi:hypothetical protein
MSVLPFARMKKLGNYWTDLHKNFYLGIFLKSVEKIQVLLIPDKNNGYFTWRPISTYDNTRVILRMRGSLEKSRKKQNTFYVL